MFGDLGIILYNGINNSINIEFNYVLFGIIIGIMVNSYVLAIQFIIESK